VLAPLQGQWNQFPPGQQERLRGVVQRWQAAPALRRGFIERRIARWAALDPQQRAEMGARWKRYRDMPPEQQQGVRDAFRHFRELPPEQRAVLRARYEAMTPTERAAFAAGAEARQRSGVWQSLLADVPAEQRAALRAMWQSFDQQERHSLRRYVRGLPSTERVALRDRLLAMTPAERSDYIARLAR